MKIFTGLLTVISVFLLTAAPVQEAALILLDSRETVTVNPDGTSHTEDRSVYRILNHDGLEKMRHLPLHFNSDYGTLQVSELTVIKPDGRRIAIDPVKNSAISTESSQMDSEIFDPAQKVLLVTVPGVEIGDTLEIATLEKQTKARFPGEFSDIAVLQADFPIKNYEYVIDMPADKPLYFCIKDEVSGTLSFSEKKENGRIIYHWIVRNVPQVTPERAMPVMYSCIQRVLVSTVKSWEEISRWYYQLCAPHLAKTSGQMKEKTAELTAGNKSDMEKINALFQFVSQNIRYTGVTDENTAPGYEPHDVDKTFSRKHGVCRDKAALLTAMLNLAGFKAWPVLFMSGAPKDREIANIYFNHAIVAVEQSDGHYLLMDPTFETTTELFPGYLAGDPYLVAKPQGETLRTAPPVKAESNMLEINTAVNRVQSRMEIKFSGIYDNMYRSALSHWKPEDIQSFFASVISRIMPGAELKNVKISPENVRDMRIPLAAVVDFTPPESAFTVAAHRRVLHLPRAGIILGNIDSLFSATALQSRRFPLRVMPRAVREKIVMEVSPQAEYELPENITINEKGLFRLKSVNSLKNDKLTGEFFIALDTMLVAPQDYQKFRDSAAAARLAGESLPVAGKSGAYTVTGANAEFVKEQQHFNIIDGYNWDHSAKSVIRILNYAGKKSYSNIIIPFIEKPEISGSVTDSQGKKYHISAKDIQYMDDKNTASAPRYIRRRQAVVTLPGVDTGSVIELNTLCRFRDRRFFFTELNTREDHPVKYREWIIEHPAKMPLKISAVPEKIRDSATFGGKRIIRRYSTENMPALPDEPGQPPVSCWVPTLFISGGDNGKLLDFYIRSAQKQVDAASPEIAGLAKKITAGKDSLADIVHAVEKYVYRHIRKVDLPLHAMRPSEFSLPQVTLHDGYGNSADRAILMAAMLKSLGIEYKFIPVADEAFTVEKADILREFPRDIYSELLLMIRTKEDRTIYLNDSGLHAPAGTLRHQEHISLRNGNIKMISSGDKNAKTLRIAIDLKADLSAEVILKYTPRGTHLEKLRERFAGFTPATERQFFEKYASGIAPQAKITGSKFASDTMTLKLAIPDFARRSGKSVYMPLPAFQLLNRTFTVPGKKRETPWFDPESLQLDLDYEISVPENFRIIKPETLFLIIERSFFSLDYLYLQQGKRKHIISFQLVKTPGSFSPEAFDYLRQLKNKLNDFSTGHILFTTE
ncbi:MAG: DUF3857 domain-containing protein [Lentisphaerae bacterium]|nr:DUF3857 domain-containing protein [Lentisphaerota bacterium]